MATTDDARVAKERVMALWKLRTVEKDYIDYARDARALRSRYLGDLTSNGWHCMKGLIRSYRHGLGEIPRNKSELPGMKP